MLKQLLIISLVNGLAAMSPGPDFAIVLANTLRGNRWTGVATAFGIACALSIHIAYCSLGLSSLLTKTPAVMPVLTLAAALYLGYLGLSILRSHQSIQKDPVAKNNAFGQQQKPLTSLWQGFLTCLFNPKAIMFIVAIYSTLIQPKTIAQGFFFGIFLVIPALIWFTTLSFLLTAQRSRRIVLKLQTKILWWMGWLLIALGVFVFVDMLWHVIMLS